MTLSPIVLDASALVEFLLGTQAGISLGGIIAPATADLHVPALCDIELCSGLRRAIHRRELSAERAAAALEDYGDLPLTRHGHLDLLPGVLDLRDNFSAYDAAYAVLAVRLNALLVTGDSRFARAFQRHFPQRGLVALAG